MFGLSRPPGPLLTLLSLELTLRHSPLASDLLENMDPPGPYYRKACGAGGRAWGIPIP